MGKKSDKSSKEKPSTTTLEEIVNKTPEPYQCIGNFATDFAELFREKYSGYQLSVTVRNKRGFSPTGFPTDSSTSLQAGKKPTKEDKKTPVVQHQLDPEQMSQEDKDIIKAIGFKPRTFVIKPTYTALKPSIFVETENIDKPDNITEISIRRWKVDSQVLDLMGICLNAVTKLTTISLWRVGLTSEAISQLAEILFKCETIKFLKIENNQEAADENYCELIKPGTHLTKLYLRYCNITPIGAKLIADELGTSAYVGNSKLLVLDLTGCPLGDFGALHLTKALRVNRTLLSLSLSNCDIGNDTCVELAKVLSRFFLTDEEIFARRQMISDRNASESAKSVSPPLSRRGDSKDRPLSVRSTYKEDKNKKDKPNAAKGKKQEIKEEKHEKPVVKNKKEDKSQPLKKVALDPAKPAPKAKTGRSSKLSRAANQLDNMSESVSENMDNIHPLLHKVETVAPGKLCIIGNYVLIVLNLSRNRISSEGLEELVSSVSYQASFIATSKINRTGLLKLFLHGNKFDESDERYLKIQEIMTSRDPKSKNSNLDTD